MGQYAGPYLGMGNNPISLIDPYGGSTIEPKHKAYEGETHFDSSDETYYIGRSDGTWLEAAKLNTVYITPEAKGGYLNQFETHYTNNSVNWSAISTGYNYQNGLFNAKVSAKTFNFDAYGYKGSSAFIMGASGTIAQAGFSASYGDSVNGNVEGKFLTADGEIGAGFFRGEDGKKGFFAGASGGASAIKGDATAILTFFGVHADFTTGVGAGNVEGGIRVGAYLDKNTNKYTIELYERVGLLIGQRAGFKITIPNVTF
jgi:hypothetical protein